SRTVKTTVAVAKPTEPATIRRAATPPTVAAPPKAASSRPPIIIRKPAPALPVAPASFPALAYVAGVFGVLALISGTWWVVYEYRFASAKISPRDLPSNVATDQQPP